MPVGLQKKRKIRIMNYVEKITTFELKKEKRDEKRKKILK
jgi:hypothetical protein